MVLRGDGPKYRARDLASRIAIRHDRDAITGIETRQERAEASVGAAMQEVWVLVSSAHSKSHAPGALVCGGEHCAGGFWFQNAFRLAGE